MDLRCVHQQHPSKHDAYKVLDQLCDDLALLAQHLTVVLGDVAAGVVVAGWRKEAIYLAVQLPASSTASQQCAAAGFVA